MLSVITPADNKALTTLDALKLELDITNGAEDDKLTRLLRRLSRMVVDYVGVPAADDGSKTLGLEELAERFIRSPWLHRGGNELYLARRPVTEIVSVTIKSGSTVIATIDPGDIELEGNLGMVRRTCAVILPSLAIVPGLRTIVQYRAGWTVPDDDPDEYTLPEPLEGAVIGLIRSARFASERDPRVKSEWTTDIERLEYWVGQIGENGAFPPEIADSIADYVYEPAVG